jgi:hypothetical protein
MLCCGPANGLARYPRHVWFADGNPDGRALPFATIR